MIRLSLPKGPCWVDLPHGVRVFVRPLTTPRPRTMGLHLECVDASPRAVRDLVIAHLPCVLSCPVKPANTGVVRDLSFLFKQAVVFILAYWHSDGSL